MSRFRQTQGTALAVPLPDPNLAIIPEELANPGISLQQMVPVLRAYWKQSVIIAFSVIFLGAIAIKFLPKTYAAEATLIVDSESKDPLAGRDFPVEMLTSYIATQIELMTSPIVLLPAVDRLNLTEDRDFTSGFKGSPAALREFAERSLSTNIVVDRGTGGQLLYLWASARNADRAAEIANTVADLYLQQDRQRQTGPASERAQRYTEELAALRDKVAAAQDKVTAYRAQKGMSDITSTPTDSEVQTLDNLQKHLLDTQNQRRTLEARNAVQQASTDEAMASTSVQTARTLLNTQLSELAQLRATFGPEHPKIKELNSQIAITRQALANENQNLAENTSTELVRARQLEQKYANAVADQQAKVTSLREAQDEGSKLILELESAQSVYKHALDGFDQIAFQSAANHANVSIVSRAVAPLRPSRPNKLKLMLVTSVAGMALGICIPLAYGLFFGRRVRCRDDIERSFGIAVLAQLDRMPALSGAS